MEAKLFSSSLYDRVLYSGKIEYNIVPYSCVPLEIAYIEHLRKAPSIQIEQLRNFCKNLNATRIPLNSEDIANAIDDDELRSKLFNSRANPYHMAALISLTNQSWWDASLLQQFQEIYV